MVLVRAYKEDKEYGLSRIYKEEKEYGLSKDL